MDWFGVLGGWLTTERVGAGVRSLIVVVAGLVIARFAAAAVARALSARVSAQRVMIARRLVQYSIVALVLISALRHLGFDLSVLVGAAGIFTVAIGFASQTSASNIISGLFLVGERPFVVGDVIRIGSTTGEVIAIDLMSVKLRTFDNILVRLPNESLLKSEIANLTHFPLRRIDLMLKLGYGEDLDRVRTILEEVAVANPLCLDEPGPLIIVQGFGDSAVDVQCSVWVLRERFLEVRSSVYHDVLRAFDAAGIAIPAPRLHVHATQAPSPES